MRSCGCRMSLLCITSSEVYITLPSAIFLMQIIVFTVSGNMEFT